MSAAQPRLLLASGSPRRRRLLGEPAIGLRSVAPDIEEIAPAALTVREITCWNAVRKGLAVARRHSDAVVIAADTLVAHEGEVIGKPADLADARKILARLSGQAHTVSTGVFISCLTRGQTKSFRGQLHRFLSPLGQRAHRPLPARDQSTRQSRRLRGTGQRTLDRRADHRLAEQRHRSADGRTPARARKFRRRA